MVCNKKKFEYVYTTSKSLLIVIHVRKLITVNKKIMNRIYLKLTFAKITICPCLIY